ncbi:unnamed protein product [Sphenostylis stenocarpa]|uniref:Uncharacterized protein n=1 Tax=Sphenostylis stenocarpa TaxID=92480 RepID=A0AA86TJD1_9FABA|nr:unnamed protein product [Sphenostylis stenocarpa]
MEKTSSWACTVVTQVCLCSSLYIALNLGHPQALVNISETSDLYFISVKGGFRPFTQQFDLLKQMGKVARAYKPSFIVSSSELGEYDPLMQNATQHFRSLRLPWYTTTTSSKPKGQDLGYFAKKIQTSNGITIELIGVDTELLQDAVLRGSLSGNRSNQLYWLNKTLAGNSSNWRIVVGYQPLVICGEKKEQLKKKQVFSHFHRLLLKFSVNVYISGQDCTSHDIDDSVAYIGNPAPIETEPYSVFLNGNSVIKRELANGFLLHQVSSVQIVTYYINFAGEIACTTEEEVTNITGFRSSRLKPKNSETQCSSRSHFLYDLE